MRASKTSFFPIGSSSSSLFSACKKNAMTIQLSLISRHHTLIALESTLLCPVPLLNPFSIYISSTPCLASATKKSERAHEKKKKKKKKTPPPPPPPPPLR